MSKCVIKVTTYFIKLYNLIQQENFIVPLTFALIGNTYFLLFCWECFYASFVLGHLIVWFVTSRHRHHQISRQKRDSFVESKNEWASQKVKFKRWNFTENICLINLLNFYQRCLLFALRKQKSAQLSPNTLTQCEKFLSFNKKIN